MTFSDQITRPAQPETDVCIIVEGCYPFVHGGVSSWIDWLIRSQPDRSFAVVAIVAGIESGKMRYKLPANVKHFAEVPLSPTEASHLVPNWHPRRRRTSFYADLAAPLISLVTHGGLDELAQVIAIVNSPARPLSMAELMNSPLAWDIINRMNAELMPHASFLHFYWAWRALFGGLFSILKFPLPRAKVYHTISTGYAGLLAARAARETGRPAVITEHGIYTNERRIDILMAEWIADTVDKGIALDDERLDLRDIWIKAFDGYARACYQACSAITTLYEDNQRMQLALGADSSKFKVIANGIEVNRFSSLLRSDPSARPTMALIGRVVPIKDIKTYIQAAARVRDAIPDVHAIIMGPVDEDPVYTQECYEMVTALDLQQCVTFTGAVQITDYLPRIHVVVLTSLSEAQPLVLLEAGAANVPCVATNVGACCEIIEGRSDEDPPLGRGGIVTDLVAPDQIANAVIELLSDEEKRKRYATALGARVARYYNSDRARQNYWDLYQDLISRGTAGFIREVA